MVIDDLDRFGGALSPDETNPLLIVDPDAVLPCAIAFERLEAIARRCPQVDQPICRVEHVELAPRPAFDRSPLDNVFAPVQRLGTPVRK
jgi:hypothetical protein